MFNRVFAFGWVSPKNYVITHWIYSFSYYPKMVWQIRFCGLYLTSWYKSSIIGKMNEIQ
jgi:hypothetical protein